MAIPSNRRVKVSLTPEGVEHFCESGALIGGLSGESFVDVRIRHTWRDVGPCRVRLAGLTERANIPLFLTDEAQFANLQHW